MREVLSRDFRKASGAATVNYAFTHPGGDSSLKYHSETTLADPSGVGQRRWSFFTTTDYRQGLSSKYEELDSWVVKSRVENTWTQNAIWPSTTVMPYISEVMNTIDVGLSSQKQSRTTQTIDAYGNNWGTNTYAYNSPTTHLRGQGCFPLAYNNAGVLARRIYSVPAYCSVNENGVGFTIGTWGYDNSYPGLAAMPGGVRLWEDPQTTVRALMTSANDGYTTRSMAYNMAGQPVNSSDGQGLSQSVTYGGVGGSMVPTQITPNSNSSLGSTMNWSGFLGLTSVSSGNGASQYFGYDAYARPSTTNSADGAQTVYSYSTSPAFSTASINSRWSKTYYDGVGRPVKVESGDAGGVKSTVLTEYEPCACSPMGKMKRVSLPYAPGGTVYWTVYTYDGLGRTLSVAQPNGSGTTTYLYVGNTVKVTSPSGKWKQYEMDAIGRMTLVTEPRPGGGTYTTSYGYNMIGKLVSVSMLRDGVTQTRTFTYDTTTQSRLLSATNPENGTVSYTYSADGTTATKTDAKGIKTEFSYDAYKRVLQMRKLTLVSSVWTEDRCQRTDYFYDEGGGTNNGRLTRVRWNWMLNGSNFEVPCSVAGGFTESYSYNSAGRILSKNLSLTKTFNGNTGSAALVANWTYNNEGQVASVTYPQRFEGNYQTRREVNHGFDSMARLNSVQTKLGTEWDPSPGWQSVISGVQFNAFGAVTSLNHLGVTESRSYNVLGQMTRMTKGSLIDVEYRFSATANDGKILSQKNWLTGEDVVYAYDELERLISASTTAGASWGLSWSFDGFGNRLSQTVTQGTGPSSVTLMNGNTNRISSAGYAYDPNGNMTQMPKGSGSMTLDYDLSNRVSGLSHPDGTEQYRYAPDNRRVWRSAGKGACFAGRGNDQEFYWGGFNGYGNTGEGQTEQVILYSPGGQKMGAYCLSFSPNLKYFAVTASEENVYYGGRLVGKRMAALSVANSGVVSAFTADRLQSKGNGSNYYPYGESKTSTSGDDREGFATYTRDEKSGLDYADQRWYASGVGRFGSPDPYKSNSGGSGDSNDSMSWNKYSYVLSDPISFYDPEGLWAQKPPPAPPPPDIPSGPTGKDAPSLEAPPPGDPTPVFSDPCDGMRSKLDDLINAVRPEDSPSAPKGLAQRYRQMSKMSGQPLLGYIEQFKNRQRQLSNLFEQFNKGVDGKPCDDPPPNVEDWIEMPIQLDVQRKVYLYQVELFGRAAFTSSAALLGSYGVYRGVRLLPSLLPPLWWTLPGNLVAP